MFDYHTISVLISEELETPQSKFITYLVLKHSEENNIHKILTSLITIDFIRNHFQKLINSNGTGSIQNELNMCNLPTYQSLLRINVKWGSEAPNAGLA